MTGAPDRDWASNTTDINVRGFADELNRISYQGSVSRVKIANPRLIMNIISNKILFLKDRERPLVCPKTFFVCTGMTFTWKGRSIR